MDIVVWKGTHSFVIKNGERYPIFTKPDVLSLAYDDLYYEPDTKNMIKVISGYTFTLSEEEIIEIEAFLAGFVPPELNHYVDNMGRYIGYGMFDGTITPSAPPTDGNYFWDGAQWVYVLAADKSGRYLGNVALTGDVDLVSSSPEDEYQLWDSASQAWIDQRTLPEYVKQAKMAIDKRAGQARLRYITDVPGQPETYQQKLKEAEAWSADQAPDIANYPYIDGEAAALNITPDEAAAEITGTATAWRVETGS